MWALTQYCIECYDKKILFDGLSRTDVRPIFLSPLKGFIAFQAKAKTKQKMTDYNYLKTMVAYFFHHITI